MKYSAIVSTLLVSGAFAQTTVMSLFFGSDNAGDGYAGSIVNVDASRTTYAVACTSGPATDGCIPGNTYTFTSATNMFLLTKPVTTLGATATLQESCTFTQSPSGICAITLALSLDGKTSSTSTTVTVTNTATALHPITITAGLDKLNGASTRTTKNAAPTAHAAKAAAVIIPGMAVLAGAML